MTICQRAQISDATLISGRSLKSISTGEVTQGLNAPKKQRPSAENPLKAVQEHVYRLSQANHNSLASLNIDMRDSSFQHELFRVHDIVFVFNCTFAEQCARAEPCSETRVTPVSPKAKTPSRRQSLTQ
jgi:hypothetical protein